MFKERVKGFWKKHKHAILIGGSVVVAGLALCLIPKGENEPEVEEVKEDTVELEWDECMTDDGVVRPIFANENQTAIYDYAFANEEVKQQYIEDGYEVIETNF